MAQSMTLPRVLRAFSPDGSGMIELYWLRAMEEARQSAARGEITRRLEGATAARAFLAGAHQMDLLTRQTSTEQNPAAMLAAAWYASGNARGDRALVMLPYRDRLALLGRYLQQLVMESLGKELDRQGNVVNQGIAVYGNKGSTDQHAYVQQLRDGRHDYTSGAVSRVVSELPRRAS